MQDGRQAYVVCPLVEENEEINAKSVIETTENIKNFNRLQSRIYTRKNETKRKRKDNARI